MKVAATAALVLLSVGSAAAVQCDPTYECAYRFTSNKGKNYVYDFSSLCSASDYVASDGVGHTYHANVCGKAQQNCLPKTWTNVYEYGVAVQTWGSPPPCPPQSCSDPQTGNPVCCTTDCQVLGTGAPVWFLNDASNPDTGGVTATFKGAAPSDSDPFWCDFNPSTGSQYERKVDMVFNCDSSVDTVTLLGAVQNKSNDCRYRLNFATKLACGDQGALSGGWIFIIILLVLGVLYLAVGALITYSQERVWTLPNRRFWSDFFGLVLAGFAFVGSGFKRGGATTGGAYEDISGTSGATYSGSTYAGGSTTTASDKGASGEAYTDL